MGTDPQVVLITHEFPPRRGGVATYCHELATALGHAGVRLAVWAADVERNDQNSLVEEWVRLIPGRHGRAPGLIRFTAALWRQRRALRGRTVILASLEANRAAILLHTLGCLPARRRVSLLHGSEILRLQRWGFWRALARRFYRCVDPVIAASPFAAQLWKQSFLAEIKPAVVIAPCAPASIASPSETGSGTRNNDGKVRILTTARLHPRKGQLELARALGDLPETLRQRVIYQLAGPGDQRYLARVKHTCHARGLTCEYLGNVSAEQLATVYAGCDVFAMTPGRLKGSVEGFGIVYLEAGLHGKPVVAWRSGGVADAVVDGKTGLLVDEGDQAGLTAALGRLVADAALGQRLGAEGRRHAMTFDWNKTAAIVRDAINGG